MKREHIVLSVAAVATLAATGYTWWRDHRAQSPQVVEAARRTNAGPGRREAAQQHRADAAAGAEHKAWLIERAAWSAATADPFIAKVPPPPPPPPPVVAAPPPRPAPPPFPYKFFGRLQSPAGDKTVYLVQGDRLIPVSPKQTLDSSYEIESISDTQIVVIYTPLGEKTQIPIPQPDQVSP